MSDKSTDDTDDMRNPDVARALRLEEYDRRQQEDKAISSSREELLEQIAAKAREWAGHYSPHSDGQNTFVLFAEWVESLPAPAQGTVKDISDDALFNIATEAWSTYSDKSWSSDGLEAAILAVRSAIESASPLPSTGLPAPAPQSERCLTCGRTDGEFATGEWYCSDPWHADDHLRAKASRATSTVRCDRCGSSGDTFTLCAGCHSPLSLPAPVPHAEVREALDAIDRQLDEMRSLKGWRLNLIRQNMLKLRAALSPQQDRGGK